MQHPYFSFHNISLNMSPSSPSMFEQLIRVSSSLAALVRLTLSIDLYLCRGLHRNNFFGPIPREISKCTNLKAL